MIPENEETCVKTRSSTHWKKKVKKIDQTKWSEANKNLYRMKDTVHVSGEIILDNIILLLIMLKKKKYLNT